MKSDLVKKLLRALVTALGIGLGSVLAFVIVQLNAMAGNPAMSVGALLRCMRRSRCCWGWADT